MLNLRCFCFSLLTIWDYWSAPLDLLLLPIFIHGDGEHSSLFLSSTQTWVRSQPRGFSRGPAIYSIIQMEWPDHTGKEEKKPGRTVQSWYGEAGRWCQLLGGGARQKDDFSPGIERLAWVTFWDPCNSTTRTVNSVRVSPCSWKWPCRGKLCRITCR